MKLLAFEKCVYQIFLTELREQKRPKKRPRPARKPFVNRDDRAIILLNLLLPEGKLRNEWNIEAVFDHPTEITSCIRRNATGILNLWQKSGAGTSPSSERFETFLPRLPSSSPAQFRV